MSRKFKLVCGWKQELMKINMKQAEHPTSVDWSRAAHAARACKKWHCAQPCSPIPVPEQCQPALPGAGFLLGTWITSLLCVAPFLPPSQRGPENLSHWAANKMQRLLITHRESLEGNFSSSRPYGSSSDTGHQLLLFSCSGTPIESQHLQHHSQNLPFTARLHWLPPQHRAATHLRRDDKLCSSPQNFKRVCHSGGWIVHSS